MNSLDNYTIVEGEVIDNTDESQMGRLKVYIPHFDDPNTRDTKEVPWARYATPFGGSISNLATGPNRDISYGPSSYGFWAVPKIGASVLVFFLNGDPNVRVYFGSLFPIASNRSLPGGRNYDDSLEGPFSDSYEELLPQVSNLLEAGLESGDFYKTRGGYERQVAQAQTAKDGKEGYAPKSNEKNSSKLDPQTYSWTSPGRHYISMQDSPEFCRVRVKTQSGHQIILDDTNERIYISTAEGKSYIEMDQDGHVHIFSEEDMSFHGKNLNFTADESFNIKAGKDINLKSSTNINIQVVDANINASGSVFSTAGSTNNIKGGSSIICTGGVIHLNGPTAGSAGPAADPKLKPDHEPWDRPAGSSSRNEYWKK